jgi:excinuclease ABC subunit C
MQGLFVRRAFTGFGPCRLAPEESLLLHRIDARRGCALRAAVRAECPRRPGVYGMVDSSGELIYVGKAKSLRGRLLSYFRPRSRDPKAGRILQHARTLVWEIAPNEFAALLRELELIQRWQPRFNVHGQPLRRRRTYVCIGRHPAPYVFLSSKPPKNLVAQYGPVPAGERAREAVRWLNDAFGLRDCPQSQSMLFAEEQELFPVLRAAGCIRYEIGTCAGPCTGHCSQSAYAQHVDGAQGFLRGRDSGLLDTVERDMVAASVALAFERAAALRDRLESLRWLQERLEHLRHARERHSFVYRVEIERGTTVWYLIRHGQVIAATPVPNSEEQRRRASALIRSVYHSRMLFGDFVPSGEIESVLLVAAWFRRYKSERGRVLEPADAIRQCAN